MSWLCQHIAGLVVNYGISNTILLEFTTKDSDMYFQWSVLDLDHKNPFENVFFILELFFTWAMS